MEDVELMQREEIDMFEDELLRHEMAAHVEMAPAPAEGWPVLDLDRRNRPRRAGDRRAAEDIAWEQLPQGLRSVKDAGRFWRTDRDLVGRHREAIALVAEAADGGIERERDTRTLCR